MDIQSIHKRILELCQQKQWSFYRLAKESGFSQSTLKSITKEKYMPNLYTINKICSALDISLSDFFKSKLFGYTQDSDNIYTTLWSRLHESEREKVLIYMYGLLHEKIPQKEDNTNDL